LSRNDCYTMGGSSTGRHATSCCGPRKLPRPCHRCPPPARSARTPVLLLFLLLTAAAPPGARARSKKSLLKQLSGSLGLSKDPPAAPAKQASKSALKSAAPATRSAAKPAPVVSGISPPPRGGSKKQMAATRAPTRPASSIMPPLPPVVNKNLGLVKLVAVLLAIYLYEVMVRSQR